jgi:DEAD/DEAH box helicase domain-containing protein
LYAYQQSHELPHVSRARAVEIIDRILAARGELRDETTLSDAPIDDLTESELERKFLTVLQERAAAPGHAWTPIQHGGKACYVLTTPNSEWLIEPQVRIGSESNVFRPSEADFVLRHIGHGRRATEPGEGHTHAEGQPWEQPIAVFCDGLRYHVKPDEPKSVLGEDVGKRRALLESGEFRVWSLTWKDLVENAGVTTLLTRVQRELYQRFFAKDGQWMRDDGLRGQSSFELLWEFLQDPRPDVWAGLATRFAASMLQVVPPWTPDSVRLEQERLRSSPARQASSLTELEVRDRVPERWGGLDARASSTLFFQIATSAVQQGKFDQGELTLRLYDDAAARKAPAFEESWRAFLHAWNILQFYPEPPEVVSSEFLSEGVEAPPPESVPVPRRPPSGRAPVSPADLYARFALEFQDGKHLRELAELLRKEGLPVPIDASELSVSRELEALLAWPEQRCVLIQEPTERDLALWKLEGYRALDYDASAVTILAALKETAR